MSSINTSSVSLSLAAVVRSLYGNSCSVKCVVNEFGDSVFVKDASLLLQLLDIEHPLAQLIVSVCTAHNKQYGSGVKSLLTMVGLLSQSVMTLKDQGISTNTTIPILRDVLSDCISRLAALGVHVSTSQPLNRDEQSPKGQGQCSEVQGQGHGPSSSSTTAVQAFDTAESLSAMLSREVFVKCPGSEMSASSTYETRVDRLKTEALRLIESEDIDDDIDWFFEDGFADLKENAGGSSRECVGRASSLSGSSCSETSPPVSSLKDADYHDDEFEDCFEGSTGSTESNKHSRQSSLTIIESKTQRGKQCINGCFSYTDKPVPIPFNISSQYKDICTQIDDEVPISTEDINTITEGSNSCINDFDALNPLNVDEGKAHKGQGDLATASADEFEIYGVASVPRLNAQLLKQSSELERVDRLLKTVTMKRDAVSDRCIASDIPQFHTDNDRNGKMTLNPQIGLVNLMSSSKDKCILNSSRHFNPSKNGIIRAAGDEPTDDNSDTGIGGMAATTDSRSDSDAVCKSIQRKLREKMKQSLGSSLTHSRHFKTFQNLTISGSVCSQNKSTLNKSDNIISNPCEEGLPQSSESLTRLGVDRGVSSGMLCEVPLDLVVNHEVCNHVTSTGVPTHPSHTAVLSCSSDRSYPACGDSSYPACSDSSYPACSDSSYPACSDSSYPACSDSSYPACSEPGRDVTLEEAAHGLTHGCQDAMELVVQAARQQMDLMQSARFSLNLNLLLTCTVIGPPASQTSVVPGLVFSCDMDSLSHILAQTGIHRNVLLVNGDVSPSFRHRGYKTAVNGSNVIGPEYVMGISLQDKWIEECLAVLIKLSVDVLLVKGQVDEKIKDSFRSRGVEAVQSVPFNVLEALKDFTETEMTVYVQDVTESHVCSALHIKPYLSTWCDSLTQGQTTHVVIDTTTPGPFQIPRGWIELNVIEMYIEHLRLRACRDKSDENSVKSCINLGSLPWSSQSDSLKVTIVLCHPASQAAQLLEQEVKVCGHRIANALHDGIVLPGGGAVEKHCCKYLQEQSEKLLKSDHHQSLYKHAVMESLSDVFHQMYSMTQTSVDRCPANNVTTVTRQETDQQISAEHKHLVCESTDDFTNRALNFRSGNPHGENSSDDSTIYDNYSSKVAAWSAAMDTVAMVIETDAHIVTGVTEDTDNLAVFVNGVLL